MAARALAYRARGHLFRQFRCSDCSYIASVFSPPPPSDPYRYAPRRHVSELRGHSGVFKKDIDFRDVDLEKKIMRFAQLDSLKKRLGDLSKDRISKTELLRICAESFGAEEDEETARLLDQSGHVFIVGDNVFLRSSGLLQKTVEKVMPFLEEKKEVQKALMNMEELKELEQTKSEIDKAAEKTARLELWGGLGLLGLTSMTLMRLTFWDLSWDVMEPICFFLTHCCVLAGFGFYLKTSRVASMDGVFRARVNARRKRLMYLRDFNHDRFNYLKRILQKRIASPQS